MRYDWPVTLAQGIPGGADAARPRARSRSPSGSKTTSPPDGCGACCSPATSQMGDEVVDHRRPRGAAARQGAGRVGPRHVSPLARPSRHVVAHAAPSATTSPPTSARASRSARAQADELAAWIDGLDRRRARAGRGRRRSICSSSSTCARTFVDRLRRARERARRAGRVVARRRDRRARARSATSAVRSTRRCASSASASRACTSAPIVRGPATSTSRRSRPPASPAARSCSSSVSKKAACFRRRSRIRSCSTASASASAPRSRASSDRTDEAVYAALSRLAAMSAEPGVAITLSYSCRDLREYPRDLRVVADAAGVSRRRPAIRPRPIRTCTSTSARRSRACRTPPTDALGESRWWLHGVGAGRRGVAAGRARPLSVARTPARRREAARASDAFTEFDGHVPAAGAVARSLRNPTVVVSPTQLEERGRVSVPPLPAGAASAWTRSKPASATATSGSIRCCADRCCTISTRS